MVELLRIGNEDVNAIEFPGYIKQNATLPFPVASMLGGLHKIERSFLNNLPFQLSYNPDALSKHPIIGDTIPTNNLLLKIKKLTNKRTKEVKYQYEIVGKITKTVRFRTLFDFQCMPPAEDPLVKLRKQMAIMDTDFFGFKFPSVNEDNLPCAFAPPILSPINYQLKYRYKQNPNIKPLGNEHILVNNRQRETTHHTVIDLSKAGAVPTGPTDLILAEGTKPSICRLVKLIEPLFNDRPIWNRKAILACAKIEFQFSQFELSNALAQFSYVALEGPFRLTWIK
jgi:hypothetical protein